VALVAAISVPSIMVGGCARPQVPITGGRQTGVLRRFVTAACGAAAALSLVTMTGPPATAAPPGDYRLMAHRGYHLVHTENGFRSATAARDRGATAMETDLRLTADGYMVVMHDKTLRRTTTCRGWVARRTRSFIQNRCRLNDGSRVPFARTLLGHARKRGLNLVLEIKPDAQGRWTKRRFRVLHNTINRRDMRGRVTISSFRKKRLARAEAAAPALRTTWIATNTPTVRSAVANGDNVAIHARDLTPKLVASMNAAGVHVYGRNSNRATDWRIYDQAGTAGVVTDHLRRYRRWERKQ
jgi:glycerophosphoryl diester phosphodiesterase